MLRENNIAALVLAGGYSSRAQAFKPLLPLGNATMVERVISNFRRAGIDDISVVTGHRADELRPVLASLSVRCAHNAYYDEGMFSSVIAGLQALRRETTAFFLTPVDIPLVKSHTIRLLYRAYRSTKADIVYPVFQGQRGHPPLISTKLIPEILASRQTGGLRAVLRRHEGKATIMEVLDEGILLDADTPADYQRTVKCFGERDVPSQAECEAILRRLNVQARVINHGWLVALVARNLAACLQQAGLAIDVQLVIAAGQLHDLAKGNADHAQYGARLLKKIGFPKVAKIVAVHHDIAYREGIPPDEAALVYLADKLVKEHRIVTIEERFRGVMDKYAADPQALSAILRRRAAAQSIGETVERITGAKLPEIIVQ